MTKALTDYDRVKREEMAEKAAQYTIQGIGINKQVDLMAKEYDLLFTRTNLLTLRKHPRYQEVILADKQARLDLVANAIEMGKLEIQHGTANMVPDLIKAMHEQIKEGNVKAMALAFKALGMDIVEEKKQDQSLTIVIPGIKQTPEKEAILVKKIESERN